MGHVGEMILVPAGPFTMGTGAGEVDRLAGEFELARTWVEKGYFGREQPQHRVTLPAYLIGRHAVTVGQFRVLCRGGRLPRAALLDGSRLGLARGGEPEPAGPTGMMAPGPATSGCRWWA